MAFAKVRVVARETVRHGKYRLTVSEEHATEGTFVGGLRRIFAVDVKRPDMVLPGFGRCASSERLAWDADRDRAIDKAKAKLAADR